MKVKITDAARILEAPRTICKSGNSTGVIPFGFCHPGRVVKKYTYFINPADFATYCGMTLNELERRLSR